MKVPYMAVAEKVPLTIQNKAYAYDTATEGEDYVDEIYEILDAFDMKELNTAYGTNTHIATAANEAYGRVRNVRLSENVPYMPVAQMVPTIQNKVYCSVSGAAVTTDAEGEDYVEEIYDMLDAISMKEPNTAYGTNTHIATAANEAYGRVRNIPVPYMPVAEMVPTFQNKAYGSVSEAAVTTHTEEEEYVDEMYEIEIPDAIGVKEPNKGYGTNTHIATVANEAYGRVKGIPVAENMPEKVANIQNKVYCSMGGAAVTTDTEEQDDVDEMYEVDELYEVTDAMGMKEPNKAYGTNSHITTTANEAYGRVKGIPVSENVPYMPVAEMVPSKAYGSVSGAAVTTDTEEEEYVDEMYEIEIPGAIGVKEPNKAYGTNSHITTTANEAYGRVKGIPVSENVPYMPVAEMVPSKAYGSVSGAAVTTDTEEVEYVDEMYEIEIPGVKEPNKAYGTNSHITTTANEAYGRVKGIPVSENVPYMPVAEMVPFKAYGSVSGAAVTTDTEEEEYVDEMYEIEIPGAIGVKEPNEACGTNSHITTTANEAYGRVKGIPVSENVPYMPVAEMVPTKAYGSVSGAAVTTDTEEEEYVDEMYEIDAIGVKEPNTAYGTNTHIATAANEAYGRVRNIPVPYMPVAEMVPSIQNKAYGSVSGAAVTTDTEEEEYVDEMYEIEIPDAIGVKEPNKAYGTKSHIATAANEVYGHVKGIRVAENVPYMPVTEKVQTIQNKVYGSVSGAAVATDTEEQDDVEEMYDYM